VTVSRRPAFRVSSPRALLAILLGVIAAVWVLVEKPVAQPNRSPAAPPAMQRVQPTTDEAIWQKRWWIEKTARLLRGGYGLGPGDDIDALLALPEEEIARRFMKDVRFGDTVLDFNMYYLGFKVDSLKDDGVYKRPAFDFSNAVAAAQALLTGGDYLKLFDLEGPFFMPPLPTVPDDPPGPEDAGLKLEELRLKAIDEVEAIFIGLHQLGAQPKPLAAADYCDKFEAIVDDSTAIYDKLYRAFNDSEIFTVLTRGRVLVEPLDIITRAHQRECLDQPKAQASVKNLTAAAWAALDRYYRAFGEILKFEPSRYKPRTVLDMKPFDLSVFNMDKWLAFGFEQSTALKNSSTNYNRRRGAYMLKHFFCDDLTPVGFDVPQQHVGGAHGSDTPCYGCHFKLDPMAGFFRDRGTYFFDYVNDQALTFDDGAEIDRAKYSNAWRAPKGSGREWSTGYVRSPRYEDHNDYGTTIEDLTRIIHKAPEAKRCLMKRLFEYMVAEEQTIDGGYLDELTRSFEQEAAKDSSAAMKNAIVRIVLSNTYRQSNPDPRACYDHAAGTKVENAPPCRVAFILQKNCSQCHSGPDGNAGLDLTSWVTTADGKSRTFPHLNGDRKQIAPHETLARMSERLSATDPAVRMPKQMVMSAQERQELFRWVQDELARIAKEATR
jgi:hypothetical protein